jgi:antitoxin component YwqK of YwqJK toxin-antitoxin module
MRIILSILVFSIFFPSNHSLACSCGIKPYEPNITDYNMYDVIFIANVISVNPDFSAFPNWGMNRITVQILKVFKGEIEDEIISVYSAMHDAACGVHFTIGENWLIWSNYEGQKINVSLCSLSIKLSSFNHPYLQYIENFHNQLSNERWYHKNGKLIAIGKLKNNQADGHWQYYQWKDNKDYLKEEGRYKNGQKDGKWLQYYYPWNIPNYPEALDENGDMIYANAIREVINYKNGLLNGDRISYRISNEKKYISSRQYYFNNKPTGGSNYFYPDGSLRNVDYRIDGLYDGVSISYYPNGTIDRIIYYYNGNRIAQTKFDENGNEIPAKN